MGIELFVENGVSLTRLFQENLLNLHTFMQLLNLITEPESAFLLFFGIYWGIDRDKGSHFLYTLGLIIVVFSALQQMVQFPSPFWVDSSVLLIETGSFAAPNLNIAIGMLLIAPFLKHFRADLVVVAFLVSVLLVGTSQIYLGIATLFDVIFGLMIGSIMFGLCTAWQRRFGRAFGSRILGQRFWAAILVPIILASIYYFAINWVKNSGYTGLTDVDPSLYWRAWQTGFLNVLTGLAILLGLGVGIALESGRIGFRPNGHLSSSLINWLVGFGILGGILYGLRSWFSASTVYESGRLLDFVSLATVFFIISLIATHLIPWVFTMIGSAPSEVQETPEISLKKFA